MRLVSDVPHGFRAVCLAVGRRSLRPAQEGTTARFVAILMLSSRVPAAGQMLDVDPTDGHTMAILSGPTAVQVAEQSG